MKIAQIIPSLRPTGPVNVALDLTALLRKQKHDVCLFYFDDLEDAVDEPAMKLRITTKYNWQQFDIVHSHGLRPDLYVRLNLKHMPKTVTTIHNYVFEDLLHTYNRLISAVFGRFWNEIRTKQDCAVVLSKDMAMYYAKRTSFKRIEIINNTRIISKAISVDRQQPIKDFASNKKIVGTVCKVTSRKGLDQVIQFLKLNHDWVFVLVGDGDLKPLLTLANELGVIERCFFMGYQSNGWEFISAFDVYVIPSISEGFPLTLIETVQLEVPVVASDINVFKEIFSKNEVSFFQLYTIEALSQAINYAYTHSKVLTSNAKARFLRDYSPEKICSDYVKLYKSLV